MPNPEEIALDCPYCHTPLYRPLRWFQQPYFTCPDCGGNLSAAQFAEGIAALEEALDASIEALLNDEPGCGGCGCHD